MKLIFLFFLMGLSQAWGETRWEIQDSYYANILCKSEDGQKLLHFQDYTLYFLNSPETSGVIYSPENRSFTTDWVYVQPCYKNPEAVFCGTIYKGFISIKDIANFEYFEDGTFVIKEGEDSSQETQYKNAKCVNPWH